MRRFTHLPYRKGVGIMLLNANGEVFVAKRLDTLVEVWQMPQGGIDEGEEPRTAALRELTEETGVPAQSVTILAESAEWYAYDLPDDLVPIIWKGRYRGQQQQWFVMRLNGPDSLINITADNNPEFSEWKWIAMEQLPEVIVPFKRQLYAALTEEFKQFSS